MTAWLSLMGLYTADNTLFDGLSVPDGVDKDIVISSIIWETAELESLLTSPDSFKYALKAWSKKRLPTWTRIYTALQLDYNPIENYNRTEEVDETTNETGQEKAQGVNTDTIQDVNTQEKTGFNSSNWQGTERNTENATNIYDHVNKVDKEGEGRLQRRAKMYGNIGVTTSQQMLEQEITVAQHNIIEIIVDDFKDAFCVMVY